MTRGTRAPSGRAVRASTRKGATFDDMAARRAERLVNLVICLLSTRQYLTAEQIRTAVPGYEISDGSARADEAFHRMFERDKGELRDLGIPLEVGRNSMFDVDDGYRIARRDYELPAIEFAPDEASAVGLAIRLWQSATLAEAARGALLKLRAAGIDIDPDSVPATLPRIDAGEPALPSLLSAVRARHAVKFSYRKAGAGQSDQRIIEPWGVLSWRGRWYVVGFDRDRDATRSFRLDRIMGALKVAGPDGGFERPDRPDLHAIVTSRDPDSQRPGKVLVAAGAGTQLRRSAASIRPADIAGWDELLIEYSSREWLATQVAGLGALAKAVEPPDLVSAVIARLQATVAAGG
jgi:proteasome accessory factor B